MIEFRNRHFIVGEPLDSLRQAVYAPEPVLDGGDHAVTDLLTTDPAGGRDVAHGLPVTAVQREGDPDPFKPPVSNAPGRLVDRAALTGILSCCARTGRGRF